MSVLSEDQLQEIVEVVWMTALELPITPGGDDELDNGACLTADINITGAWQGNVSIRASSQFLTNAASMMFSCTLSEVSDTDRADTLTELTNMLGGTVKCLLPEICDLSLPKIRHDSDNEASDDEWVCFYCEDSTLAVAITETDAGALRVA